MTRQPKKPFRPFPRTVHIDGRPWSYQIDRHKIRLRDPSGNATIVADHSTFTGLSDDALERAGWKQGGYKITPADIVDFVRNTFTPVRYEDNYSRFVKGDRGPYRPRVDRVETIELREKFDAVAREHAVAVQIDAALSGIGCSRWPKQACCFQEQKLEDKNFETGAPGDMCGLCAAHWHSYLLRRMLERVENNLLARLEAKEKASNVAAR